MHPVFLMDEIAVLAGLARGLRPPLSSPCEFPTVLSLERSDLLHTRHPLSGTHAQDAVREVPQVVRILRLVHPDHVTAFAWDFLEMVT